MRQETSRELVQNSLDLNNTISCPPAPRVDYALNRIRQGDVLTSLVQIKTPNLFDIVIADPPYNIGKDFGNNKDNLSLADYTAWSKKWLKECMRLVKPGCPVFVYGLPEILAHLACQMPIDKQRWLVWHYTNKTTPYSTFWQRSHETILCLWKGSRPKIDVDALREPYTKNYVRLAGRPRKETKCRFNNSGKKSVYGVHPKGALPRDVLRVPALAGGAGASERWFLCRDCKNIFPPSALRAHDSHDVLKHPTQKPAALTKQLLLSVRKHEAVDLLVPFAGSGSECVIAKQNGVNFLGIEINPEYVKLARGWLARV